MPLSSKKIVFFLIGIIALMYLAVFFVSQRNSNQKTSPISPYQKQIDQLDSLVSTIKAMPQPLDPKLNQEGFEERKRDVEAAAQEAKDALAKGDIENARKKLSAFKASVRVVGDPLKGNFIPKEIRNRIDPQGLILKPTDRVDPAIMDWYLAVVQMELALLGK